MRAQTFAAYRRPDGTFHVEPGFVVAPETLPDQTGPVEVFALAANGDVLAVTQVPLVVPCAPPSVDNAPAPEPVALGVVAVPDGTTRLRAVVDGTEIWSREAPEHPLEVDVQWPAEVSRGPVEVGWTASVENCRAALGWTADGRAVVPLSRAGAATVIHADLSTAPGGAGCAFVLQVTDGWHTVHLRSGPLTLPEGGWRVWILAPADGDQLPAGQPVQLAGQAYHLEDHRPDDELTWSSSLTGALGTGGRLVTALEPGEHTLTASRGPATAEIHVRVTR